MNAYEELFRGLDPKQVSAPQCFIEESESHFLISVEIPEVPLESLAVVLKGNLLGVSGERACQIPNRDAKVVPPRSFARVFHLPPGVSTERIEAEAADGSLEILIPREEISFRKIPVRPARSPRPLSRGIRIELRGRPPEAA